MANKKLAFQDIILTLQGFWSKQGANLMQAYDNEVGAGTMSPYTFLRSNGPEPWGAAYVQPSRRPADGRYGENPNRLFQHHQFQVVLKPSPKNIQELYLQSLAALGIDALEHDIRFVEDNWENPSMGCAGIGWEVWIDGQECTQFTYFQQVGGIEVDSVTSEITYGLERIATVIQEVDSVYDLNGEMVWLMVISSKNLNTNILNSLLKNQIKNFYLNFLVSMNKKPLIYLIKVWFTQLMIIF